MKISKERLKQIIKEELENLEEYSPYKTGARPDKPHKKPGETKDDGKYADPKRARPKKRYEEQQELEEADKAEMYRKIIRREKKLNPNADDRDFIDALHKQAGVSKREARLIFTDLSMPALNEELTRQDKTDVKKMVQDELGKLLKKKDTKDQMGEIVKKIMKKLYKDLSLEHPYIIDRIKI